MQNLTVSVGSQAASAPLVVNSDQPDFKLGLFCSVAATSALTYSVEVTGDDPQGEYATDFATNATWFASADLAAETTSQSAGQLFPVTAVRLNVTAYTSGSVTLTVVQGY